MQNFIKRVRLSDPTVTFTIYFNQLKLFDIWIKIKVNTQIILNFKSYLR